MKKELLVLFVLLTMFSGFASGVAGVTRQLYYISGADGLAAIYVKQQGQSDKIYYAHRDHLGSILSLTDADGMAAFKASYDAWGKQTITTNTFKFHRGYTGHEHLPWFNLINMNARLYDPVVGRFLSPDPYVQAPDMLQNFNRYSYCLNNPLMYVDEDGEFFWLIAGAIGFVVNYVTHGISTGNWGMDAVKSGLIGGASAMIGAGIGWAASSIASSIGIGSSITGIIGSTIGGAASGFSSAAMTGNNVGQGALFGAIGGLVGGTTNLLIKNMGFWARGGISTLSGGLVGGGFSVLNGGDFWTGFRNGAIGAAAGFIGNEITKYVQQRNAEEKYMKKTLGLTDEDVRMLKKYGWDKIKTFDCVDNDAVWEILKGDHLSGELPDVIEWLRNRDIDPNAIIKAGRMHIRYGSEDMINGGGYNMISGHINVHYDRFDVIMFPLLHLTFDSLYQWSLGVK